MSKPPHKKSPATATLTVASKKAVNNLAPPLDATPTPAVASTITERPSPIKNGNGVQVQVKISLQMQQKFDKLQKELLQLQAEKSARETEELTSAHLAAKKQQKQRNKSNATKATQQLRPPLQTMMMTLLQWRIQHWITHLKRTTVSGAL
jgi:hypothetical protein